MNGICDLCNKPSILDCPDCDLEVCEDHSRSGECIYCTEEGWVISQKAIDFINKWMDKNDPKIDK